MDRKICKMTGCFSKVWKNSYFGTSEYCWEHDPDVKAAQMSTIEVADEGLAPTEEGTQKPSVNYSEGQLREAIYTILRHPNNKLPDNDIRVQRSIRHEIREEQTDQLLALFHTYGNRERVDELEHIDNKPNVRLWFDGFYGVDDRIKELNREVES